MKHSIYLTITAGLLLQALPVLAAPPEVLNGGDNGGSAYVDGATTVGDTVATYTDGATTPNSVNAVSSLTSVSLVLPIEKEIRDITGKPLANGTVLVKGATLWYTLWVWNRTAAQTVSDVRLSDILPAGVTYAGQMDVYTGSLAGDPAASTTWTTAASWSGLAWTTRTTAADSDSASLVGTTLTLGAPSNSTVNVSAGNVLAIRFKVRIN